MARAWQVFPGKATSKTDQVTISDPAMAGGSSDDTFPVLTVGPQVISVTIDDALGLSEIPNIFEKNAHSQIFTNPVGLVDSRTVIKNSDTARSVVYGSSLGNRTFAQVNTLVGGLPALRHYSGSAGGGLAKFNSDGLLQSMLASSTCKRLYVTHKGPINDSVITTKSRWDPSDLENWWGQASFPGESSDIIIYVGWWHEPIEDWTTTQQTARYRQLTRDFCDYVHQNGPSNVFVAAPCWQTAEMYKTGTTRFNEYWPGNNDPSGVPYVDFAAADIYSRVSRASDVNVTDPTVLDGVRYAGYQYYKELFIDKRHPSSAGDLGFQDYFATLRTRQGRWLVGEFASGIAGVDGLASSGYAGVNDNNPRNGFRRSRWLADTVDKFDANSDQVEAVFYWNQEGNLGNYFLDSFGDVDTPPVWRDACDTTVAGF